MLHNEARELVEQTEAGRRDFLARLRKFDLPVDNRFVLCQRLCALAETNPSDELLRADNALIDEVQQAI